MDDYRPVWETCDPYFMCVASIRILTATNGYVYGYL